jgi:uncharacterized glyoxalase superfamily protein PhnB
MYHAAAKKEVDMGTVKAVPEGLHTITPNLRVAGAAEAMALYEKAFGAERIMVAMDPSGTKVWHAALRIGDSQFFLNDDMPEMGAAANSSVLWLYLGDVDAAYKRAVDAGLETKIPPGDMFWGDRMCSVRDRFGNEWNIATHVKDMTPDEMQKAQDDFVASMGKP